MSSNISKKQQEQIIKEAVQIVMGDLVTEVKEFKQEQRQHNFNIQQSIQYIIQQLQPCRPQGSKYNDPVVDVNVHSQQKKRPRYSDQQRLDSENSQHVGEQQPHQYNPTTTRVSENLSQMVTVQSSSSQQQQLRFPLEPVVTENFPMDMPAVQMQKQHCGGSNAVFDVNMHSQQKRSSQQQKPVVTENFPMDMPTVQTRGFTQQQPHYPVEPVASENLPLALPTSQTQKQHYRPQVDGTITPVLISSANMGNIVNNYPIVSRQSARQYNPTNTCVSGNHAPVITVQSQQQPFRLPLVRPHSSIAIIGDIQPLQERGTHHQQLHYLPVQQVASENLPLAMPTFQTHQLPQQRQLDFNSQANIAPANFEPDMFTVQTQHHYGQHFEGVPLQPQPYDFLSEIT
uniref:TORC_N domain-containing protein n=1 Tax=Meloidogyne hapla TaxID=6305 RepID=A0A1I8C0T4_MELHA